jgi:heat shock protein HslJ
LLLLLTLAGSVSQAQKVALYPSNQDVSRFQTYSWITGRSFIEAKAVDNPPLTPVIQQEVDAALKARGYQRVDADGAMKISFLTTQGKGLQVDSIGNNGEPAMFYIGGAMPTVSRYYTAGTLVVSMLDKDAKGSIYLMILSDAINKPEQVNGKIARAVQKGFKKFPVVSLAGTAWTLTDTDVRAAATAPTLRFAEGNAMSGNSGCNTFAGTFTAKGFALTVSPMVGTLRACEPEQMQRESAFLQTLKKVQRFSIADQRLMLDVRGSKEQLQFVPGVR